jgi:hypothetical protein
MTDRDEMLLCAAAKHSTANGAFQFRGVAG